MSGTTALVGANVATVGGHNAQGAAYLFNTTTGAQTFKLTASDGAANNFFGNSTALSGSTALVGAYNATVNGNSGQGAVYLYDTTTGAQTFKLTAPDGALNSNFGYSVALSGTTALVGAYPASSAGRVYAFDTTNGNLLGEYSSSASGSGPAFGYSVALSGTTALAGTPYATVSGHASQGSAYLFSVPTGAAASEPTVLLLLAPGALGLLAARRRATAA